MGADEALESELGLGELAGLTVANEADSLTYDVSSSFIFVILHYLFFKNKKMAIKKQNFFTSIEFGSFLITNFENMNIL